MKKTKCLRHSIASKENRLMSPMFLIKLYVCVHCAFMLHFLLFYIFQIVILLFSLKLTPTKHFWNCTFCFPEFTCPAMFFQKSYTRTDPKLEKFTPLGCKDIENIRCWCMRKTQFLNLFLFLAKVSFIKYNWLQRCLKINI